MKRITCSIGLVLSLGLLSLAASAQNQTPSDAGSSLGDYARHVRKAPATKQKVFDNDNLPVDDKLSIVGPTAASTPSDNAADAKPADTASTTLATGEAKPQTDAKTEAKAPADAKAATDEKAPLKSTAKADADKAPLKSSAKSPAEEEADKEAVKQAAAKQWADRLTSQKEQIDLLAREIDVLQREYQIRAAAMYADAGNRMRNAGDWDKQDTQYKQQIADKQKAIEDAKQKLEDMQEDARKAGVPASVREP